MGQENSSLVSEDIRPETLSDRSIAAIAELIKNGQAKQIVVMAGAGISTAAGSESYSLTSVLRPSGQPTRHASRWHSPDTSKHGLTRSPN